ncbi:CLUMA_CG005151, isoform A [Clunio marinus]|uniref:CLUMA_CG005151, isoform A n=1 Tax=Clunio marinus TaxID=568069 RepID=A0A1J1HVU4_9DIPT|nr:CLUMA_CG005151, isoform A [Clunio marinus]
MHCEKSTPKKYSCHKSSLFLIMMITQFLKESLAFYINTFVDQEKNSARQGKERQAKEMKKKSRRNLSKLPR